MYKILISGYYGFHNIGDEAILRCVTQRVTASIPNASLTILSNDPEDTREKYNVRSVDRMHPLEVLRAIRQSDMLISGGGSLLQDVTSRVSILYYLMIILAALLMGKRVFVYSQGIGPINGRLNRFLTGRLLRRVDGIAVRDEKSAHLLSEIGVPPESVAITADPVLQLSPVEPEEGRKLLENTGVKRQEGRLLVGWAVKSGDENFLREIQRSVRHLREHYNADSVLIPFHHEQDAKCIRQLRERLGDEAFYVTDKLLMDQMLSIIGNLDLLVGVRLHSLIYGVVSGVPTVGISYDPKIDAFLESVGRASVSTQKEFTLEKLLPAVDEVLENRQEILLETEKHVSELREKLDENDRMIRALAEPRPQKERKKRGGLAASIGSVMLITILAKVFGILRESVQANVFGAADAYYAGYNKTIYLFTTAAYAMCVAAVPIITKELQKGRKAGEAAANNLTTFSLLLSLIALGLWEVLSVTPLAPFVYGSDLSVLPFVRIMALSLPVIVVAYLMVALFQSMDHFALQGSMSLPHSLFLIAYLVLFGNKDNIMTYVWLVCVAWVLQFAMCLPYAVKEKYRYRPRLKLKEKYIGTFLKTALVTIVTGSMYLFCYLLDASATAELGEGTTSAFYYADKLFTPLTTTFIYSISAVLFPKLSREYTRSEPGEYKKYVWGITGNTLVVVLPVCAILMLFGGPILKVLFESGNFTADSTARTTEIFVMYALGMAGFSVMDLLNKAFITMDRPMPTLLISLGTIGLNLVLNFFLKGSGPMVALGTAVSMTAGAAVLLAVMFRGEKIVSFRSCGKSLLATAAASGLCWWLRDLFVSMSDGKLLLIVKCCGIGVVFVAVFVAVSLLVKQEVIMERIRK